MAREFGAYSPIVPLGVTWEESMILEDINGTPIDLAGYDVRAQFYLDSPIRDPLTGIAIVPPIAEITSPGWYGGAVGWTVIEGADIPTPTTDGMITTAVSVTNLWTFSPMNLKTRYYWSIVLVNPSTGYAIPVVSGRSTFKPARTI